MGVKELGIPAWTIIPLVAVKRVTGRVTRFGVTSGSQMVKAWKKRRFGLPRPTNLVTCNRMWEATDAISKRHQADAGKGAGTS